MRKSTRQCEVRVYCSSSSNLPHTLFFACIRDLSELYANREAVALAVKSVPWYVQQPLCQRDKSADCNGIVAVLQQVSIEQPGVAHVLTWKREAFSTSEVVISLVIPLRILCPL